MELKERRGQVARCRSTDQVVAADFLKNGTEIGRKLLFDRKTRKTRTERLTERLEKLVPWSDLLALIQPFYYESGRRGRQPFPLELMLRIHRLQIAYNMSEPQMEDFLHENSTARQFVGLALADRTPDESTILQFRHLLEKHNLGKQVLERVNAGITAAGLVLSKGRIIDASFIEAPSSTKNRDHKRDPEMSSGKKGNTWHFGTTCLSAPLSVWLLIPKSLISSWPLPETAASDFRSGASSPSFSA